MAEKVSGSPIIFPWQSVTKPPDQTTDMDAGHLDRHDLNPTDVDQSLPGIERGGAIY